MPVGTISTMSRNPVVLVHGIYNSGSLFRRMKLQLERDGLSVHCLSLIPSNGSVALAELAQQVDLYIRENFEADQAIDIVGFSMGGLVSRYYIQRLGGLQRVHRFVTIGTPHRGTWTAFLLGHPGVRNMRPRSIFLEDLNRDIEVLTKISFTSIWTPFDLMILPAKSSLVPVGRSIRVRTPVHRLLVYDRKVLKLVLRILRDDARQNAAFTQAPS